nr:putative methyltransferase NSUN7 [Misgurnus anguillicaudatus]
MVRKGSSLHSSKHGSQISSLKHLSLMDPVPPEAPVSQTDPSSPEESPSSPSDRVYLQAAAIFQNTNQNKPAAHRLISYGNRSEVSVHDTRDESSQRQAYQLAFNALKYQELLEDVLIDSCFFLSQPMSDVWMSLVAVVFTDLLDRKFLPRNSSSANQDEVQEVREVEACLLRFKTKLVASLARCRIKHHLLSLDNILPDHIRHKQDKASRLPLYAWVNTLRTSMEKVNEALHASGFSCVKSVRQLKGQTFCKDPHCHDLLVFPNNMKTELIQTGLLTDYGLIIQDKSCCVGPCALLPLLAEGGDVLMAGCLSAQTVAHVSAVVASAHTAAQSMDHAHNTVFVCLGDQTLSNRDEVQRTYLKLGCKNVKLLSDSLHSLDVSDVDLQKVRVIFLMPVCSLSAVSNPVDYILQENADSELLLNLTQDSICPAKLQSLTCQQRRDLQRALIFPKVSAVLYSTCSVYSEENEELLNRVLKESEENSTAPPYRLSDPGLLQDTPIVGEESKMTTNFFKLEASDDSNGCFLALLTRQPEPEVTETPQEVLARAAAKGLLSGAIPDQPIKKRGRGRKSRKAPAKRTRSKQTRPDASEIDQSRIAEFLQREARLCNSEPSVSRSQSSSNPSQSIDLNSSYNPAGSRRLPQGVLRKTGSTPNTTLSLSSASHRSLRGPVVTAVSTNGHLSSASVRPPPAPLKGRQEVLQPATITFPPVVLLKDLGVHPSLRRSHALPLVHSDSAHLPQTRGAFKATFYHMQP